jgi:hypothetical protein
MKVLLSSTSQDLVVATVDRRSWRVASTRRRAAVRQVSPLARGVASRKPGDHPYLLQMLFFQCRGDSYFAGLIGDEARLPVRRPARIAP